MVETRFDQNRRGAALVLVAVCLVALTGVGAVVVDLGMLLKARNDAQRAAEAGALAGASAFLEFTAGDGRAIDSAQARARRFAEANTILGLAVTPGEVQPPDVIPDSQKVRVVVERSRVGTWFARILGVGSVPISAHAAAMAIYAGNGSCVKPFAVPDIWNEQGQDPNANHVEDPTENWTYDPATDDYKPGDPDSPRSDQTGYGSGLRNDTGDDYLNDSGRPVVLRLPDPAAATPYLGPREFLPFSPRESNDPDDYRRAIEGCDPDEVKLGDPYRLLSVSPQVPLETKAGVDSLVSADPEAHWDNESRTINDSRYGDWRSSPRTIKIGLFDPGQMGPAQASVTLNNLALLFVEGFNPGTSELSGRLFYFARGAGDPDTGAGTLVKRVLLVE